MLGKLNGHCENAVRQNGKDDKSQDSSNEDMDALIEQYHDVFASELPEGVPPDRNAFETIPLEPNSQ